MAISELRPRSACLACGKLEFLALPLGPRGGLWGEPFSSRFMEYCKKFDILLLFTMGHEVNSFKEMAQIALFQNALVSTKLFEGLSNGSLFFPNIEGHLGAFRYCRVHVVLVRYVVRWTNPFRSGRGSRCASFMSHAMSTYSFRMPTE